MNWTLFWTIIVQLIIGAVVVTALIVLGLSVWKTAKEGK